ncbi:hypothetical protein BDV97DRAFT_84499 [Delphinella strobiligena]|nr:hypothetical protein BDV97DRAFT_84499 [Delphinella strobiligena]
MLNMPEHSKPRRTHIKSKSGCKTCRIRRVRCDEFKPECINCRRLNLHCGFRDVQTTASQSSRRLERSMQVDAPLKPSLEQLQDFAYRDRYFYAHLTNMIDDLQRGDSHLLAFPTTLLPEYVLQPPSASQSLADT